MKRLVGPLDVEFINRTFFSDRFPSQVNKGWCFRWAYIASRLYQGVELWDVDIHAFVKYQGNFYDSEKPSGEADWRDLPAANMGVGRNYVSMLARKRTVKEFQYAWRGLAKQLFINWDKLDQEVAHVIRLST